MRELGVAVDFHVGLIRRQRPGGTIAVTGRDLGVLEAVAVAEELVHLFAGHVHVRSGNEDGAVLEPARTRGEVEFGLRGVQHVASHAGFHLSLDEDPVGRGVVAGEIGLHVVFATLEQHVAGRLDNHAVVKADEVVGIKRPGRVAAGAQRTLTCARGSGKSGRGKTRQRRKHGHKHATQR